MRGAAAIIITVISQIKYFMGVKVPSFDFPYQVTDCPTPRSPSHHPSSPAQSPIAASGGTSDE